MTKQNEIATKKEQVELTSPNQILDFATSLKKMIVQNNLYTNIKGKNYVNVEGWQIAGAFTGTFPVVEKVEQLPTSAGGFKYRAEVSIRDKEGAMVGYGVAICSNQESGKKNFDEYAVASMAQTRAVGKAYRMKLGWLLKVAGYETTPAEEMDTMAAEAEVVKEPSRRMDFDSVRRRVEEIDSVEELENYWRELNLTNGQAAILKKTFAERKAKIGGENVVE